MVTLFDDALKLRLEMAGMEDQAYDLANVRRLWPRWLEALRGMDLTPEAWAEEGTLVMHDDIEAKLPLPGGGTLVVLGDGELAVVNAPASFDVKARSAGFRVGLLTDDDDFVAEGEERVSADVEADEDEGAVPRPAGRIAAGLEAGAVTLAGQVAANAVLVTVSLHAFGIRRKTNAPLSITTEGQVIDESILSIGKKLIDSPTWEKISKLDGQFRRDVEGRALPSRFRRGTYLLPLRLLDWFEAELDVFKEERAQLVEQLCSEFEQLVEDARVKLGPLFDRRQYPTISIVRQCYRVDTLYESPGVPQSLADFDQEIYQRETRKLQNAMEEAAQEARMALRTGLLSLVENLQEKLVVGDMKRLKTSAVTNLTDWLDLFADRDITNDADLAALVEKCRKVMGGVDRNLLASNERVRAEVKAGFAEVTRAMGGMVESAPVRRFKFTKDDDD